MGKLWVVGALLLLGWIGASMYFVMSGSSFNLPPEVTPYMPHFVIVLAAGLVFFRFRKTTGEETLDRANLYAVASGVFLLVLLGFALATWGNDPVMGRDWLFAAIAWSPIAIYCIIRYRNLLNPR